MSQIMIVPKPTWLKVVDIASAVTLLTTIAASFLLLLGRLVRAHLSTGVLKLPDDPKRGLTTRKGLLHAWLLSNVESDLQGDGQPVDLPKFWKSVQLGRCLLLLLAVGNCGIQIYSTIVLVSSFASPILPLLTEMVGATYFVLLSTCFILARSVSHHQSLLYHIACLLGVYLAYCYFATIGQYLAVGFSHHITWEQYAALGTVLASLITVICIPSGPPLYQDMSRLYNKAVTKKIHETGVNDPTKPNTNEETSASILSKLLFRYVYPTISKTSKMEQADLQDLPAAHAYFRTQNVLHESVAINDQSGLRGSMGSTMALLWTVWRPERTRLLQVLIYDITLCPLWYIPHICTQQILWLLDHEPERKSLLAFGGLLTAGRLATAILLYAAFNLSSLYASPRISCHSSFLLFQKVLTRNTYATPEATGSDKVKSVQTKADILNLISSDSVALSRIGWTCLELVRSQTEMSIGCSYVWILLGPSGLWGLCTLLLTYPPAYFLTKIEYRIYEKRLEIKDEKVSMMQEAIQAISMIKMTATELVWFRRIKTVREREFSKIVQARLVGFVSGLLYEMAPTLVVLVAFAHYTLVAKKTLTASVAFTSIGVFDELRPSLIQLPTNIAALLQQILSAKRIGNFLRSRDVDYMSDTPTDGEPIPQAKALFVQGTITWDIPPPRVASDESGAQPVFQLRDLDIHFPRGEMTLIAGKFGAGKTLLLLALLGEVRLVDGKISYAVSPLMDPIDNGEQDWSLLLGGVAYVPQTPWLQSLSIRDNILFGLPMNVERYKSVIYAVGLLPDLALLDDGDLTEIGERGKILSGGQKARVSLARALYSRASILILDDIISAVDAQTSQHIIRECFSSDLTTGRTIIIASHAVEAIAPLAHNSIFLDDGRAVWSGTGPELLESDHMQHLKTEAFAGEEPAPITSADDNHDLFLSTDNFELKEAAAKTPKQLVVDEKRDKGMVGMHHWYNLKRANGGHIFWIIMALVLTMSGASPVIERSVLEHWTQDASDISDRSTLVFWVALYAGVSLARTLLDYGFSLLSFFGGMRAMRRIHARMLDAVLRAKMIFFSKTRAGSIIQRFGDDLQDVLECSELMSQLGDQVVSVAVSIVSVSLAGGWVFGATSVILIAAGWKPGQWYRSASRQVRRLQAVIPGPINAHYGEAVAGAAVIRAFGAQSVFVNELLQMLNMKINVNAWTWYIGRWLSVNLRLLDIVTMTTALGIVITTPGMTGARAGFILVFASGITWSLQWVMMNLRSFELKGVSLERVAEYESLETEDVKTLDDDHDPEGRGSPIEADLRGWPSTGAIEVKGLRARYGPELPDILHDVSFGVRGGERVGIVGATGGGKSTLAKAFFSFVEVPQGRLEIDGKNIYDLPLGLVRSKLGIIAQDPILLSGSLRLNLDIYGNYTDEQLYNALHHVQLLKASTGSDSTETSSSATAVEDEEQQNIFGNLDSEIKSGGENLSAGQKQLVVLARALLQKHKVLILDEATASIDSATDSEISRVVHEEFTGVTVLIIAHRLRTIMPCSKILVMDKGRLVQQGSPSELIKQSEFRHLTSLAEQSVAAHNLIEL